MSTFDYAAARETASRLINFFGAAAKVIKANGRQYNVTAARVEVQREGQAIAEESAYYVSGSLTQGLDVGDIIQQGTLSYRVTSVEILSPAGQVVYYKALVA